MTPHVSRWSAYGGYQRSIWYQLDRRRGVDPDTSKHEGTEVVLVQAAAALLGGCTSAFLTNPLDVVKTRLQAWLSSFWSELALLYDGGNAIAESCSWGRSPRESLGLGLPSSPSAAAW